jgi:hypothetical protein
MNARRVLIFMDRVPKLSQFPADVAIPAKQMDCPGRRAGLLAAPDKPEEVTSGAAPTQSPENGRSKQTDCPELNKINFPLNFPLDKSFCGVVKSIPHANLTIGCPEYNRLFSG